jgi:hypothetical protein
VRNIPDRGCVFTIDLPQSTDAPGALTEPRRERAGT